MADTFSKKEFQKKRAKKKQDKAEKREERKLNNNKGKSLEEMTVYLDEYGNLTDIPPHKQRRSLPDAHGSEPGSSSQEAVTYIGVLSSFFADKNFGFITDDSTHKSIFVHGSKLPAGIKVKERVSYEKSDTPKGAAATNVQVIKQ